jgi:ATP adenylyltransferase
VSPHVFREFTEVLSRIWAPWRAQYVRDASSDAQPDSGCFLCRAFADANDRRNLIVLRQAHSFVVLNRYPYNNGHLLVAPRMHRGTLAELSGADLLEPIETIQKMIALLDRMFQPQGYNVGLNLGKSAGAGLPGHLHWHIVPRWDGDTNFMPILADAKVLIESLEELFDRISEELRRMPA